MLKSAHTAADAIGLQHPEIRRRRQRQHPGQSAINQAIPAAAATGGGTILVPAGTYLSGSIHLNNNINLDMDAAR